MPSRHTRVPSLRLKIGSARDDSSTATGSQKADCTAELRSAWTAHSPVPTRTRPHTNPSPHEPVPTRTRPHTNPTHTNTEKRKTAGPIPAAHQNKRGATCCG